MRTLLPAGKNANPLKQEHRWVRPVAYDLVDEFGDAGFVEVMRGVAVTPTIRVVGYFEFPWA
jgi:hypothetical protein